MANDPASVAEGIGLIQSGLSERAAAKAVGVPKTTLHRNYQKYLGPNAPNKDEQRKAADERLLATAYCAAEQALSRMAEELDQADHRTVTAWADVSLRAVGRLRGWDRGLSGDAPTDRFSSVIERVLAAGGGTLSVAITPHEPAQQCIDVSESSDELSMGDASESPATD